MDDERKTKRQLIADLAALRKELSRNENSGHQKSEVDGVHGRAEEGLRPGVEASADLHYRALVEQAADGIIVADPGGKILEANQVGLEMLGYSLEEITQRHLRDLIPPEDLESNPLRIKELKRGKPVLNKRLLLCKDGTIIPVEISAKKLPDGKLHGIVRDIRQRADTERALRESVTRYQALLAALPDLIFRFDRQGIFLDYHAPSEDNKLYVPPDAFLGKAIDDVLPPDVAEKFHRALDAALESSSLQRFEYQLQMADATQVFEARLAISGADEVTAVVRDITRQKAIEDELRNSETRYRSTVEQSPYSIVIYSPDGRTLNANQAALEAWNITPAGLDYLRSGYNVLEDEQLEKQGLMPYMQRAFAGEATRLPAIEYDVQQVADPQAVSDAPGRYWIQGYAYPVKDADGGLREVVVIHENITHQKQAEEALRVSEERFRELAENIREVFWLFDWQERRVLYVSPAYEEVWGRSAEDLYEGREAWGDSMHTEDRAKATSSFLQIAETGERYEREYRIVRPDGEIRWVSDRGFPITDEDGQVRHIAGIAEDITERKEAEAVLKESEEKFRALAEQSPNMIFINQNGRVVYANRRCREVMGYSVEELCSPTFQFLELIAPEDRNIVRWSFETHMQGQEVEPLEYTLVTKDGNTLEVVVNTRLMDYQGGKAILGTVTDISRQKQVENRLAFIASHDALTGLPNRMALDDRLEHALHEAVRRSTPLALLLLDLDNFKNVNDTLGHPMGDKLLQAVGTRLLKVLRKSDTVARMGGDEFMLLLADFEDIEDLTIVSQKTLDAFRQSFSIDGHEIDITTSIGIAQYPQDGENAESLKKHADIALYKAKDQGRNNYQFYSTPEMLKTS